MARNTFSPKASGKAFQIRPVLIEEHKASGGITVGSVLQHAPVLEPGDRLGEGRIEAAGGPARGGMKSEPVRSVIVSCGTRRWTPGRVRRSRTSHPREHVNT